MRTTSDDNLAPSAARFNDRRRLNQSLALGAGSLLFSGVLAELLAEDGAGATATGDLTPREPHFLATAKRVIFLYMSGGVSHVDSFDPKPQLVVDHGASITLREVQGRSGEFVRYLTQSPFSTPDDGKGITSLFPKIAEVADDLCIINSMRSDNTNHFEATLQMHTGSVSVARPCLGSWLSYGLGTENQDLPAFIVIAPRETYAGQLTRSSDFLPASHQGTLVVPGPNPVANLRGGSEIFALQELEREFLKRANYRHLEARKADSQLRARIQSFETAYGMQTAAPDVFDLSKEHQATLDLYGLEPGQTTGFGWQCLVARRLVERGVRFVELIDSGSTDNWDGHIDIARNHSAMAAKVDQPIAGLLRDLKQRGMLDDTLVVWTTEFGRTPFHATLNHSGREHHHYAFSVWLAGGGVKPGFRFGQTDPYGIHVERDPVHVHDLHATILHLMGIDHRRLTFRHAGRDFRLTDVYGRVIREILA